MRCFVIVKTSLTLGCHGAFNECKNCWFPDFWNLIKQIGIMKTYLESSTTII